MTSRVFPGFLLLCVMAVVQAGQIINVTTTFDHDTFFLTDYGQLFAGGTLEFNVTASGDVVVTLSKHQNMSGCGLDVVLGALSNTAIAVRERCRGCPSHVMASGTFLGTKQTASFWMDWSSSPELKVGQGPAVGQALLFSYVRTLLCDVNYVRTLLCDVNYVRTLLCDVSYVVASSYGGRPSSWTFSRDSPPHFRHPSPDGSTVVALPEDAGLGSTVVLVTAQDHDGDDVTLVVIGQHAGTFRCQGPSIILTRPLDYESHSMLVVMVMASDGRWNTTVTFTVTVTDLIDERPVLSPGPVTTLQEEQPVGSVVAGTQSRYFAIDARKGHVTITEPIDRDGTQGVTRITDVTVWTRDCANLTTSLVLDLEIQDVNDNPSVFERDMYTLNVSSDVTEDVPVLTFHVTDADEVGDENVTLSLLPGDDLTPFRLSGHALFVRAGALFGDVSRRRYGLVVTATDGQNNASQWPPRSAVALVMVQVIHSDVHGLAPNSSVPDISSSLPEVTVSDTTTTVTSLLSITTSKYDTGHGSGGDCSSPCGVSEGDASATCEGGLAVRVLCGGLAALLVLSLAPHVVRAKAACVDNRSEVSTSETMSSTVSKNPSGSCVKLEHSR